MNQEFLPPLVRSQRWKLWLAAVAVGVVAIAYIMPERVSGILNVRPVTLELFATAIGLVTMFAVWASVRCPSCGLRLVRHAMSTKSINTWLSWLLDAKSCPKCGYHRVLNSDVAEAPDASAAIAAAEVVAASLGKPSPALPVNLKAWLSGQPQAQIAAQAALAERALSKIEDARHSELRQLWSEGKANQWLTKVQALQSRIGSK